jgi:hypothetical protein
MLQACEFLPIGWVMTSGIEGSGVKRMAVFEVKLPRYLVESWEMMRVRR